MHYIVNHNECECDEAKFDRRSLKLFLNFEKYLIRIIIIILYYSTCIHMFKVIFFWQKEKS